MQRFRSAPQEDTATATRVPLPPTLAQAVADETAHEAPVAAPASRSEWGANAPAWLRQLMARNPLLKKELRAALDPPRQTQRQRWSSRVWAAVGITAVYGGVGYLMSEVLANIGPAEHAAAWRVLYDALIGLEGLAVLVAPLARIPYAIAREREKQTWNALLLSRLTPQEILSGKLAAGLAPLALLLLAFLPLTLSAGALGGISLGTALLAPTILLATALLFGVVSLHASWKNPSSQKAGNEAGMGVMGIAAGAGAFWSLGMMLLTFGSWLLNGGIPLSPSLAVQQFFFLLSWINPAVALFCTLAGPVGYTSTLLPPPAMTLLPFVYLAFAGGLTRKLWKKMIDRFFEAPKDFTG